MSAGLMQPTALVPSTAHLALPFLGSPRFQCNK